MKLAFIAKSEQIVQMITLIEFTILLMHIILFIIMDISKFKDIVIWIYLILKFIKELISECRST